MIVGVTGAAYSQPQGLTLGVSQEFDIHDPAIDTPVLYGAVKAPVYNIGPVNLGIIGDVDLSFDALEWQGGEVSGGGYLKWHEIELGVRKHWNVSNGMDFSESRGDVTLFLEVNFPVKR